MTKHYITRRNYNVALRVLRFPFAYSEASRELAAAIVLGYEEGASYSRKAGPFRPVKLKRVRTGISSRSRRDVDLRGDMDDERGDLLDRASEC